MTFRSNFHESIDRMEIGVKRHRPTLTLHFQNDIIFEKNRIHTETQ